MLRKQCEGIEWLEFELFADIPHLVHAVFLKGLHKEAILHTLHVKKLIHPNQSHGVHLMQVSSKNPPLEEPCDGVVTR